MYHLGLFFRLFLTRSLGDGSRALAAVYVLLRRAGYYVYRSRGDFLITSGQGGLLSFVSIISRGSSGQCSVSQDSLPYVYQATLCTTHAIIAFISIGSGPTVLRTGYALTTYLRACAALSAVIVTTLCYRTTLSSSVIFLDLWTIILATYSAGLRLIEGLSSRMSFVGFLDRDMYVSASTEASF